MNDGWIKLHRRILDNDIWRFDYTAWRVFETLLLICDRRTGTWKGGRKQLANLVGDNVSDSTVYKAIVRLKNAKMVTLSSNSRFSVYSICKWEEYQGNGNTKQGQPSNSRVTARGHSNKNKEVRSKKYITSEVGNELLMVLNKTLNREFRVLPTGYEKTLQSFTLQEIESAMKNLAVDAWHSDKLQSLKVDYLIRDTTIDKFRLEGSVQVGEPRRMERLNLDTGKMEVVV